MIRVLIAEDDPRCYQELERFLDDYSRETGRTFQITHYDNGEDLVERYRPEFDLLLLDVDMPFLDGMTAAGHIRGVDPEVVIVFVTNLAQYAIQGYSVNALDYILKPLELFLLLPAAHPLPALCEEAGGGLCHGIGEGGRAEAGGGGYLLH